nr:hypothetical protein Iba_chr13bCG13960 [Ipomoea batatas]
MTDSSLRWSKELEWVSSDGVQEDLVVEDLGCSTFVDGLSFGGHVIGLEDLVVEDLGCSTFVDGGKQDETFGKRTKTAQEAIPKPQRMQLNDCQKRRPMRVTLPLPPALSSFLPISWLPLQCLSQEFHLTAEWNLQSGELGKGHMKYQCSQILNSIPDCLMLH